MKHELKIKPEYFAAVFFGEKTFEIRNNADRNFQVGDTLMLKAWDGEFTGDFVEKVVSYITDFEQKPGYVVLGLVNHREHELLEKFHRTGVAIERAISTGSVLADHPLKSRLELLANHHKREQALADGIVAMADRCKQLTDLLREARNPLITAMEASSEDASAETCELLELIDSALAGTPQAQPDADWTEATATPTEQDYRELQAQHNALQSKYRAAQNLVRDIVGFDRELEGDDGIGTMADRIDALLADQLPSPTVTITETIRTAPERIWLQVGDQASDGDYQFPEHHDEVSWCADSVVACEVPYVRADLADKVPEQHKTNWPDKCPITRRDFFMEIDGVPTYGGPYDSYTIPEMLGTPEQPWHERELFVRRFDHDEGRWVDDEIITQRVIHDGVLDELLDLKEQQADQVGVEPQGGEQLNKNPAATAGQPAPTLNKQPSLTGQVLAGMGAATLLAGLDKESASDVVQLMLEAAEAKGGEPCDSASPSSSPD